ncbi:MAG TPA: asparagine synthase (glutamine-hydrolyzing) [Bryobacteraceae bacterium]|jgi:asparagine synthase (glutamine-hydrolysing)|nr:asparagine synthase (glutamine-hydrolyzing) [Bryobacteraceae bacterium]
MCGIAGFVTRAPGSAPDALLARMTDAIRHRGPDAAGYYRDPFASLGHRRLSIIDIAGGQQPMSNEDGALWITYNGEIFNHADLRTALEQAGHRYRTRCDTETILHAYEQYGPDALTRFRGMFAFAIWDKNTRTLFCARDRLGKKPFYYYWDGHLFAFASEIKALLAHPAISPRFEESLLSEYLNFGYCSGAQTLFAGIRKLMPGHWLRLTPEQLEIRQYWELPCPATHEKRGDQSWIVECRSRLEEAVRTRLMSDVPLGMFLSGGVDSSAIAALMKPMSSGPVKTFAVGYREQVFSELSYARHVAETIGTEHHEVITGRDDFFNALPQLIWHEDEPIAWPSSVSLYFVSRLAAEHVKVVLTGEGSDELFAGYGRYRWYLLNQRLLKIYRAVPRSARDAIRAGIATSPLLSSNIRRKLQHSIVGRGESLEALYLDNFYAAFSRAEQQQLLAVPFDATYDSYLHYWIAQPNAGLLQRMLYADQKTYLVELLMKQDQMSMACSIESRVPFLDHQLVEFAAAVPDHMKLRGGIGKYILKRAVEDILPRDIVYRKKMGFPTPLRQWLVEPEADSLIAQLNDRDGLLAAYLDFTYLNDLLDRHKSGLEDATDRIWRLLNLQLWGNVFITSKAGVLAGPA